MYLELFLDYDISIDHFSLDRLNDLLEYMGKKPVKSI
jgi:hypothetical protein